MGSLFNITFMNLFSVSLSTFLKVNDSIPLDMMVVHSFKGRSTILTNCRATTMNWEHQEDISTIGAVEGVDQQGNSVCVALMECNILLPIDYLKIKK